MDISKITDVKELKAMAYDQLASSEVAQSNLRAINARIAELDSATASEDVES
jgi:hypothetical protein